jgi:uncharacterized protein with PIN domain
MNFLADNMLGSLAKWLRILGYDVAYPPSADDNELVRLARAEGRVLLTRDTGLARRRGLTALLIESESLEDQVRQVIEQMGLSLDRPFSRCSVCNTSLQRVDKDLVRDRVPPYVFQTQDNFSICPHCDKIYWQGTHWVRMQKKITSLRHNSDASPEPDL